MKHILVLTALIGAIFIFTGNVEATRCDRHCSIPQPSLSPSPTGTPYVTSSPSPTKNPEETPTSTPSATPEPSTTASEVPRTDLSDGRSDNLGCSVNDCSGNKVEPQVAGQSAQVLPATGDRDFIMRVACGVVGAVIGFLLRVWADGKNI